MFLRDNCDNCDATADVGIPEEQTARLSLRIWQCIRCGHLTVTAFDWERDELVCAEIFDARREAKKQRSARR